MSRSRILPAGHVSTWDQRLDEVGRRAFAAQAREVRVRALASPAGGVELWSNARWRATVSKVAIPEVRVVIREALAAARAQVPASTAMRVVAGATTQMEARASLVLVGLGNRFGGKVHRLNRLGRKPGGVTAAGASDRYYYDKWGLDDLLDSGADELGNASGALASAVANAAAFDLTTSVAQDSSATRIWAATGDDRTRDAHQDADGQEVGLNEPFDVGGEQLDYPGDPSGSDENCINCRCIPPWALVGGCVTAAARRPFDGDLVYVATARGHTLAATPDHPVLTDRGWVLAGEIKPGDSLLRDRSAEWMTQRHPHEQDVPAHAHEVFRAVYEARPTAYRVGRLTVDLDGTPAGSQVETVGTGADLAVSVDAALGQPPTEFFFAAPLGEMGGSSPSEAVEGVGHAEHVGLRSSADRDSRLDQAVPDRPPVDAQSQRQRLLGFPGLVPGDEAGGHGDPLGRSDSCVADDSALPGVAGLNPGSAEPLHHRRQGEPSGSGDLLRRFPGQVAADGVVDVERRRYVGLVYDLQSTTGWLFVDGIVTHNCWVEINGEMVDS